MKARALLGNSWRGGMCLTSLVAALAAVLLAAAPVQASTLVYDNGAPSSTDTGVIPQGGQAVTDSFTVSADTSLTTAILALWTLPDDSPLSVDWAIGTSAFGSDVSSGVGATLSNTSEFTNSDNLSVFDSSFSLNGSLIAGTTYWLTILNVTSALGQTVWWDQNSGASLAFEGDASINEGISSESFQLYGNAASLLPVAAPLPAAGWLGVLGLGVLALGQWAGRTWRKWDVRRA